jgi:hypothetical protein
MVLTKRNIALLLVSTPLTNPQTFDFPLVIGNNDGDTEITCALQSEANN